MTLKTLLARLRVSTAWGEVDTEDSLQDRYDFSNTFTNGSTFGHNSAM
jgi:hypothetical protein